VASILGRGTGVLLFAIVARKTSTSSAGTYALAVNYLAFFLPLASLGLDDVIARDVAKDRRSALVHTVNLGLLRLVGGLICYGILAIVVGVFDYPADTKHFILLMGLNLIPGSLNRLFQALFTAFEQQIYNAITIATINLANLIFSLGALLAGYGLIALTWIRLTSTLLGLLINSVLITKNCPPESVRRIIRLNPTWVMSKLKAYLPFTLMVVFYTVEWHADILILSVFSTQSEMAYYHAAQTLLFSFLLLLNAYRLAALPLMSRLRKTIPQQLRLIHSRSIKYLFIIAIPITIGVSILSQDLLFMINPEFIVASSVLTVLMFALPISFLNEPNGLLMIVTGHQNLLATLLGASVLVNIIANLILVPLLGGLGSAIARVISVIVFSVPNAVLLSRKFRITIVWNELPMILLAAMTMAIVLHISNTECGWALAGIISVCIYFSILLISDVIPVKNLTNWLEQI